VETASIILPPMVAAGSGHFVALSSIGDGVLSAEAPSYAASKAGLSSYLAGLALALRPRGVAISNVRFGFVDTKMAKSRVRPMMISVTRAVDVIVGCLESRRPRVTFPRAMALAVHFLRMVALLALWLRPAARGRRASR
jgi:short-subunit dehydrogenase